MARREITEYIDDLDKSTVAAGELEVIYFSVDDTPYAIELGPRNAAQFRAVLEPYVAAARRLRVNSGPLVDSAAVRTWARARGIPVARRGKISQEVVDAYNNAQQGAES